MYIDAENGGKMLAMTVFGESIKYMRGQLLDELKKQGTGVRGTDIHWVLTVPAIWTEAAKQFMREAAQYVSSIPFTVRPGLYMPNHSRERSPIRPI